MKLYLAIMAAACMGAVSAADLFNSEKLSDFANGNILSINEDVFSYMGRSQTSISSKIIPIDPAKKYKISVKVRSIGGKVPACYLGFVPFDAKGSTINHTMVDGQPNTLTVLAEPLKKGDQFIKILDGSAWNTKSPHGYIAFGAKADLSDIPNSNLMKTASTNSVVKKEKSWIVYLNKPATKEYPKGTAVRQHLDGSSYVYAAFSSKLSANWLEMKGTISGIDPRGYSSSKFWKGTKSVRVLLMTNQGDRKTRIEFKDLDLKEDK